VSAAAPVGTRLKLCALPWLAQRRWSTSNWPPTTIIGGVVQTRSGAMRIYKLATHDGNYTVYRNSEVLCCGLTRTAADGLISDITAARAKYQSPAEGPPD
jgi:hypothetical protein